MATAKKKSAAKKSSSKSAAKKSSATKSTAKKSTAAKKAPAKKKSATKRAPSAAFMKPMTPSAQLAAVVGTAPLPRTEVTKKLWAYIKKNDLQDKTNRRNINADDKLKPVFNGSKQVSMFEMTRLVNKHLK